MKGIADPLIELIREVYGSEFVPLHRPVFELNERKYLVDCIDSNFVSSVGEKVTEFENEISRFTGSKYAVATVNGTAALQVSLQLAGVERGDEVITQALTFIATCNAINYLGAQPVFIDVDRDTMGLSPDSLESWLQANVEMGLEGAVNKHTGSRISACVPMHTFGFPCRIKEITEVCKQYEIPVVEDAAESLGSYSDTQHTGTFGKLAAFSFNGNKIITTGGGGMIITDNEELAVRAKHLTTTAKVPHPYEFEHDEFGYNFRLPNLNAALGCAQMEALPLMLEIKAGIAFRYSELLYQLGVSCFQTQINTQPNYWLNGLLLNSRTERNEFLEYTNSKGVMTRPIWRLMSTLRMFEHAQHDGLENSQWLADRVVNLPSSVPESEFYRFKQ